MDFAASGARSSLRLTSTGRFCGDGARGRRNRLLQALIQMAGGFHHLQAQESAGRPGVAGIGVATAGGVSGAVCGGGRGRASRGARGVAGGLECEEMPEGRAYPRISGDGGSGRISRLAS